MIDLRLGDCAVLLNDTYFQIAKDRIENTSINQGEVSKTKYEQVSLF